MGKRIEAIKRMLQSSKQEVLASYLNNFVLNSEEHFWKTTYYNFPAFFELNHDNNVYMLDVLYIGQETSFPLSTFMRKAPDYKSVLAITDQLLKWLENTYALNGAPSSVVMNEPKRPKRESVVGLQRRAQSVTQRRPGNTPIKAPKNGLKQTM